MTADSVDGADHALRRWLQEHKLGYVLAVTKARRPGSGRVEDRVAELPAASWHRLSAGGGDDGHRSATLRHFSRSKRQLCSLITQCTGSQQCSAAKHLAWVGAEAR